MYQVVFRIYHSSFPLPRFLNDYNKKNICVHLTHNILILNTLYNSLCTSLVINLISRIIPITILPEWNTSHKS